MATASAGSSSSSTAAVRPGVLPYPPVTSENSPESVPGLWSWAHPVTSRYEKFSTWRRDYLGFPNPGSVENLMKEVKMTHLNNWIFDGARADLTKALSMSPAFQVTHSFALGSANAPSSYTFGAVFANAKTYMQGNTDNDGNLTARANYGWTPNSVSKLNAHVGSGAGSNNMFQFEHDYLGSDYSLNVKTINASPTDGNGLYVGSYLQSITKRLALGVEAVHQRAAPPIPGIPSMAESTFSYIAKYSGKDWIATATLQPMGILQTTYYQKLGEKLDVAADLQLINAQGKRDAVATVGAKYALRTAQFRAQVDSSGKVSALLEQQLAPSFAFMVAGEIDHFKNNAKVGVGIMIESGGPPPEEQPGAYPPGVYPPPPAPPA